MSTNTMNFGPAWMRGDTSRAQSRTADSEGRNSPTVLAHSNGSSFPPQAEPQLHPPGINGISSTTAAAPTAASSQPPRATSFSYSSVLTSQHPSAPSPSPPAPGGGPGDHTSASTTTTSTHDKPFKYTREEMLNIWKANSAKFRATGIPLEFERHDAFTSEEPLEPVLLTEMTLAEKEAFAGPLNSDKPDSSLQARLDRASTRQFSPRNERSQSGVAGSSTRPAVAPRNRTLSRGEAANAPFTSPTPARSAAPRPNKSREYFAGAFGGGGSSSTTTVGSGSTPPEKDIWGSATKKGSFDENGKFVVADEKMDAQQLEAEEKVEDPLFEEPALETAGFNTVDTATGFVAETTDSQIQVSEGFTLSAVGGRTTSRFSSFGLSEDPSGQQSLSEEERSVAIEPLPSFTDDREDDVLKDILNMRSDPRAISPPRQMDRLTSRFANQSLSSAVGPEPSSYSAFSGIESFEPIRRDSQTMSQFFPSSVQQPTPTQQPSTQSSSKQYSKSTGLFEHPVVPSQPTLPPPPPQTTRVMIMADKLKWVYKDPHGNVQGPFTGLEMHEWYRGGYFHPTLEVKREDDKQFEPLQTLVKKIGNQREPFLVPLPSKTQTQVIPPRSTTTLSGWNTTLFGEGVGDEVAAKNWISPVVPGGSTLTGTTLTADQQNALERRKQEEQYMLVRQREMVVAAQSQVPPLQPPLVPVAPGASSTAAAAGIMHPFQPLHHPYMNAAYPGYGPVHGLPMGVTHHVHSPAPVQVQTLPALDTLRTSTQPPVQQPVAQQQTPQSGQQQSSPQDQMGLQDRVYMNPWGGGPLAALSPMQLHQPQQDQLPTFIEEPISVVEEQKPVLPEHFPEPDEPHPQTLLESEPPNRKSSMPSIPLKSPSPIPESEPEPLELESTIEPPPSPPIPIDSPGNEPMPPTAIPAVISPARVAPWAQRKEEVKKSLSLKEIQELESKRAAETAKRLAAEKQALAQAQQQQPASAAATGQQTAALPANSTWGASSGTKSWAAKTTAGVIGTSPGKKSMAQIQKEEEEDRARLVAAKTKDVTPTPVRGYAGAAAVTAPKPAMPTATAWTVIGPGGRPQPGRPIHSGGINPSIAPQPTLPRPPPVRSASQEPKPTNKSTVQPVSTVEDFQRWCRTQIKSLTGVNYDDFYQMIVSLPPNESTTQEIISEAIYSHSSTLDGRHFAEEFLKKRRALGSAVEGAVHALSPSTMSTGGGWNEVLKKEKVAKDSSGEWNSAFKVVAGKKGRRRG